MLPIHARTVNVVETLAFATVALLIAVPFSAIFRVVSFENILK